MRLKLISEIPVNKVLITPWRVGLSYLPGTHIYFGQDGPVTAMDIYNKFPESFTVIGSISVKIDIIKSLTAQYSYFHSHYQLNEEGMAIKIEEIANKIISKI